MIRLLVLAWFVITATQSRAASIDPADLEAFADGVIETTMENERVPGVVLAVIVDGDVALLKGYGHADIGNDIAVDPATTMFRPGSVTKLFTWVALMQLEEAGRIDLDTDINSYLDGVEVPPAFDKPITIADLMTHTPGFEDHVIGLFSRDETDLQPLAKLLEEQMPQRMRPPGALASYSNHGVALAGLIVEQVSGEPWAEYIERHILEPLDMNHTTMRQPLPEELAPHMAKGYVWSGGRYVAEGFEFVPAAPAGSASASGGDMIRFAAALVGDGGPILSPSSNARMKAVLHRANDAAGGLMHGLYEMSSHGQFMLGHGGDTKLFHSELVLMPEQDIAWFISTNAVGGPAVRSSFRREFMDRYFARSPRDPVERTPAELQRFAGSYAPLRSSWNDFTKLGRLMGALSIAPDPETGELLIMSGGNVQRLTPIGAGRFANPLSETVVSFDVDESGRATHMHLSSRPVIAYDRLTGLDSPALHNTILTAAMLVFGWILVAWTIQRHYRRLLLPRAEARFRLAAWWTVFSVVLFGIATVLVMGDPNEVGFGLTPGMQALLLIPWLTLVLAVVTLVLTPAVLREEAISPIGRIGYAAVMLVFLAFIWFLYYWQLL